MFFILGIILILSVSIISSEDFGYNLLQQPTFNNNTAFVNATQFWNTLSLGPLDDANDTQFDNNGGTLTIDTTWLDSDINLSYLRLDGTNIPTANYFWTTNLNTTGQINPNSISIASASITLSAAGELFVNRFGNAGNVFRVDTAGFDHTLSVANDAVGIGHLPTSGDEILTLSRGGTNNTNVAVTIKFENDGSAAPSNTGGISNGDKLVFWNANSRKQAIGVNGEILYIQGQANSASIQGEVSILNGDTATPFETANFKKSGILFNTNLDMNIDEQTTIKFGLGSDASIGFNSTDFIFDPRVVGSGDGFLIDDWHVTGQLNITGNIFSPATGNFGEIIVTGDVTVTGNITSSQVVNASILNIPTTNNSRFGVITMNDEVFIHSYSPSEVDTNIFIGKGAGNFVLTGNGGFNRNLGIGFSALSSLTSGTNNIALGFHSGDAITSGFSNFALGTASCTDVSIGGSNICIGTFSGFEISTGSDNIMIGRNSGIDMAISSNRNVVIGSFAGEQASGVNTDNVDDNVFIGDDAAGEFTGTPTNNVAIGQGAGETVNGSGNIYLGKDAGGVATGNNKLYIHNNNTATPLIYGEFDNRILIINGNLNVTTNATFQQNVTILGTLFGGSPVKIAGGLNVTGNLIARDNLTIEDYFFLSNDYSLPPGQSKILKRNSATKAVFGVQNEIASASTDSGAGYVLNTSVAEYRIDLHSALDLDNPNDTVHHLLGANNREIWRLNPNSDSSFRFEGGLDSEIIMINRTGLFVTGNLTVTGNLNVQGNITINGSVLFYTNGTCNFWASPDSSTISSICNV